MTEAEARRKAEQVCIDMRDRCQLSYVQWLAWVEKIAAALVEAGEEKADG